MIRIILLIAFIALMVNAGVTPSPNPQQARCAQPPKGCSSQRRTTSCTNWNGCQWTCGPTGSLCEPFDYCKANNCCSYNPSCAIISPTVSPTRAPTTPTTPKPTSHAPTPEPTVVIKSPTAVPTTCTNTPKNGCQTQRTIHNCNKFSCCHWLGGSAAQGGKCFPTSFTGPIPCKHYGTNLVACRAQGNCKVSRRRCVA